jgi:hypothetical protein
LDQPLIRKPAQSVAPGSFAPNNGNEKAMIGVYPADRKSAT